MGWRSVPGCSGDLKGGQHKLEWGPEGRRKAPSRQLLHTCSSTACCCVLVLLTIALLTIALPIGCVLLPLPLPLHVQTNTSGGLRGPGVSPGDPGVGLDILIPVPPERIGKPAPAGAAKEALTGAAAETAAAGSGMHALAGQGARRKTAAAASGLVTVTGAGAGAGVHCRQKGSKHPERTPDAAQQQQEGAQRMTQAEREVEKRESVQGQEARRHLAAAPLERKHSLRVPSGLPKRSRRRPRPPPPSPDPVSQPATSATQGEEGQAEEEEDDDDPASLPNGASDAPVPPHHPAVLAGTHVKLYSLPWAHKLQRAFWRGSGYCTGYPHYFVKCSR